MIEYSKFYKTNRPDQDNDSPKTDDEIRREAELEECKKLIQQLGYAYFND